MGYILFLVQKSGIRTSSLGLLDPILFLKEVRKLEAYPKGGDPEGHLPFPR